MSHVLPDQCGLVANAKREINRVNLFYVNHHLDKVPVVLASLIICRGWHRFQSMQGEDKSTGLLSGVMNPSLDMVRTCSRNIPKDDGACSHVQAATMADLHATLSKYFSVSE